MNKSDSEILSGAMIADGYKKTDDAHSAGVLIFNTCAIRGNAENRAFSRLQEFNALRKKHKISQIIVVSGCVPQYEKENFIEVYPYVDIVIGANSYEYLPEMLSEWHRNKKSAFKIIDNKDAQSEAVAIDRETNDQAFMPITYGCNNFCSYCIVPYTRGREVSRTKDDIFSSIEKLAGTSYTKLLLLGQNVNSYGRGLYDEYRFADLLEDILSKFAWIERIDFLTSHPKDITDKLIGVISSNEKIGKEIHFPIQHGDDRILKLMNRGYSVADYKAKVKKLRASVKGVKISTDLIVGFPGETEQEFQNMVEVVKEVGFYRSNTAAYSPRKGTGAASMENQIDEVTKKRRLNELNKIVREFGFKG